MSSIDKSLPAPNSPQARDYILTMLEGLASLARGAADAETGQRLDVFRQDLIEAWSPNSTMLLARDFGRLDELVAAYAVEQPQALALVMGDRKVPYGELDATIDRLGAAFQREGLGKGDVIALCAGASVDYLALFLAGSRTGVVVAPLATWLPVEQIRGLVADSGARRLFTDIPEVAAASPAPVVTMEALDAWMAPAGARPHPVPLGANDTHYIMYSSGTTGVPKGVVQSYMSRWRGAVAFGVPANATFVVSTPLYSAATIYAWGKPLAGGGTAVLMPKFDAGTFLQLAEAWRATDAVLVPVQAQRILAHPEFDSFDLSAFASKMVVSAPFDAGLKAEMLRRWPGGLTELYGMSEGGAGCMLDASARPDKLHTVGPPLPTCDLRIIDDLGAELPRGAIGEIVGRSRVMMQGYHNQPEATAKTLWFDAEGRRYIRSGDIGRIDPDGFVELLGRKKDMIISGGQNIYPIDLETVLDQHPAVLEAAVVGRRSDAWGEEPVAFVTLRSGAAAEPADLLAWLVARLGSRQRPAEVIVLDELPRSPIGKVLKRALRAMADAA